MTITARHARRQLSASRTMLDRITVELPLAIDIIAHRIEHGTPVDDDRPKREDAGIRGKGGHSDPTGDTACARAAGSERWLDDIGDQLATLALTLRLLIEPCSREVISAANSEDHPRSNGGSGVDEWTRPDCTDYVSYQIRPTDGSYSYRSDGRCDASLMRRYRWERRQAEVA